MGKAITDADVSRFRLLLEEHIGFELAADRAEDLATLLKRRLRETGAMNADIYFARLASVDTSHEETRALAEALTIGETYFFRHPEHFSAFVEVALPARLEARKEEKVLRILSVGCSTGEEAHTVGILLKEHLRDFSSWNVQIVGVDVNPQVLAKAREGKYTPWSLRQTPLDLKSQYFSPEKGKFALAPAIRSLVTFHEGNLMKQDPRVFEPGSFDIIFCRNVLIYFSRETLRLAVENMTRALAPRGYLFLGTAESLSGISEAYSLVESHETFYYRLRGAEERSEKFQDFAPVIVPDATPRPAPLPESGKVTWKLDEELDLGPLLLLFKEERFTEAAAWIRALPAANGTDARVQLLLAAVLSNMGNTYEAEGLCRAVLAQDHVNPGAHYLAALCRDQHGDRLSAMVHDRWAIDLDPGFALPHLHIGLLAIRDGEKDLARREIACALHLLSGEKAERILLFGGGFNREALKQMCRAKLERVG